MTPGERLVEARVRAALAATTPDADVYANVRWLAPTRPGAPPRDGESDLVIVHPEFGLLVIEVKDGPVARDGTGRWYAGHRALDESPFHQAEAGKHAIEGLLRTDPRWPDREPPRTAHAVAFPGTDRASLGPTTVALGPDAPSDLVLDRADLADPTTTARALERVLRFWSGDGSRDRLLGEPERRAIGQILEPTVSLRPLLHGEVEAGERALLEPTRHQLDVLKTLRWERRATIHGGAGSGKTLLAIEKARQLASEGYRTLFVCFNQPLARHRQAALRDQRAQVRLVGHGAPSRSSPTAGTRWSSTRARTSPPTG